MEFTQDSLVNMGQTLQMMTSHPGFLVIKQIVEEMCSETAEACAKFEGWDVNQKAELQTRMHLAYGFRDALYTNIKKRIEMGEQAALTMSAQAHFAKPEPEKMVEADDLREKALKLYEQMNPTREEDDGRIPGTYVVLPDGRKV